MAFCSLPHSAASLAACPSHAISRSRSSSCLHLPHASSATPRLQTGALGVLPGTCAQRRSATQSGMYGAGRRHRHRSLHLQANSDRQEVQGVLEAFFFGRALITVATRRASEAFYDAVAEISKALAERPDRIKEFQEEVVTLAKRELYDSQGLEGGSVPASGGGSRGDSRAGSSAAGEDIHAVVDDLRAEIASSRVVLMQIRQGR